jgi:hypothetical protein
VINRSRFIFAVWIACLSACGQTPQVPNRPILETPLAPAATPGGDDPDLDPRPRAEPKLVAIDWATVNVAAEADALALWPKILPTAEDWEDRLGEVPDAPARPLAIAFLRAGKLACTVPPPGDCAPPQFDVPTPKPTATLADPCLRRLVALWALDQLETEDFSQITTTLRAIAALPPPESELLVAMLDALPETEQDLRVELLGIANRAGQRELVDTHLGTLDVAHLETAVRKHHIGGALEVLSAEAHRATYLAAIADEAMSGAARAKAILELASTLDQKLPPELRTALIKAGASKDCMVAAAAARALEQRGDKRLVPRRPRTRSPVVMMRALCVLASYEQLQGNDEPSLLTGYVPTKGLERIDITYDPYDDPHTAQTANLVPRGELVMPEIEDVVRAMRRCKGTTCSTSDRDFRFSFKPAADGLQLFRLEIIERPPCVPP